MMKLHIDIETGDPDDLWMLALMSTHPKVDLQGVTVFPGGRDQIALVKKVLQLTGREDIPVGANVVEDGKSRVSSFYRSWLGDIGLESPDEDVLGIFQKTKGGELLTGGPLRNIKLMSDSVKSETNLVNVIFDRWTCQGGFVGSNIIPDNKALDKFKGQRTVSTFNLNGDPKAALALTSIYNPFRIIRMVGKNVCHGFIFGKNDIAKLPKGKHRGLDLMIDGMEFYYQNKPDGKAMHDILAALMHINPEHGKWVKGLPYREKGKWGFEEVPSNLQALVGVSRDEALQELT